MATSRLNIRKTAKKVIGKVVGARKRVTAAKKPVARKITAKRGAVASRRKAA